MIDTPTVFQPKIVKPKASWNYSEEVVFSSHPNESYEVPLKYMKNIEVWVHEFTENSISRLIESRFFQDEDLRVPDIYYEGVFVQLRIEHILTSLSFLSCLPVDEQGNSRLISPEGFWKFLCKTYPMKNMPKTRLCFYHRLCPRCGITIMDLTVVKLKYSFSLRYVCPKCGRKKSIQFEDWYWLTRS